MLDVGSTAPSFALPGTAGEEIESHRLADALERGPVVLVFYVFDFHPECTDELCTIRDAGWFDVAPDATVFGIGTDSAFSHRVFAAEHGIEFTLLADTAGRVADAFGVRYDRFRGHDHVAKRAAFLLDESGTIQFAWASDDPQDRPDWQALKQTLDTVRTDR
jgi:peroxiredoxin